MRPSTPRLSSPFLLLLTLVAQLVHAIDISIDDEQSVKSAASEAVYGAMKWYSGNDTGGIPGAFPDKWWEGSALFLSTLLYWHYTGDDTYNSVTSQGMEWQAGNGDYMPANYSSYLGNDDQVFWGIAAMTAAEINFPDVPDKYSWLSLAQGVYNTQVARWDTSNCGGGLRWQIFPYQAGYNMKNSISNGGLFQLAARLARYTNNQTYADWADKIWDWSASTPLLNNQTWNVADSTDIETGCKTQGNNQWSYNYGTYLTGAAYMYNLTEKSYWKDRLDGLLGVTLDKFFPQKYGGNVMSEILCEPQELCNNNEILFKGLVTSWLGFVAMIVPSTYDQILPKLQGSAQSAAQTCTGMGNNSCGVRWYGNKWDGWHGMEEQISVADVISSAMLKFQAKAPLTSSTGGTSSSDPNAGGTDSNSNSGNLKPITTGDKAGAGILTVVFVGLWGGMVAWLFIGG
ncbi:glycosyl hydrolase [Aspergillus terreus]|uniref:Mannan endo-1,6-alpha-mannosidase n=1 Tax=Aspergillus terreus TaxID=33178 RepID=A0A5M3Z7W5_ASPTE|nr:hypothetical protein ATETN484_0011026200 [Aspergillus terreus]GFF18899.1 glycosyl hydrolase [Aspergillus terreus]